MDFSMTICVKKRKVMFKIKRVMIAVFLTVIALLSLTACRDKKEEGTAGPSSKVSEGSCPVVCVSSQGYSYNYMHPYNMQMDAKSVYGCLTPAGNGEAITFKALNDYSDLARVEYTLYDKTGKLVENGTVSDKSLNDTGMFEIALNNLTGDESRLEIKLCFNNSGDVYYYTRVVAGSDIFDDLQYVTDIENACMKKESPVDLTLCMEWDLLTNKPSYYESDINSSYEQVTWAGLNIGGLTSEYFINIVDYSADIISFSVSYGIYSNDETPMTYQVNDFLRVRELDEEMFLLNFYRNTYEDFCESKESFSESSIYLGVGSGQEEYISFENDTELVFVQNQSVYYYNSLSGELICIYSPTELAGSRAFTNNMSNIRLLDKRGNYFYFMLGGYLCNDMHLGSCGMSIMRYDMENNCCEELFFRAAKYNYRLVMDELDMLSYMSDDESIYFIANGEIHSYNVNSETLKEEVKNISLDNFVASPDGERVGWSKKQDGGEDILAIRNLNTSEELMIYPKEGTQITPIGFVKEDFVYGISYIEENNAGVASDEQILMHKICIVDASGNVVKEYNQESAERILGGYTSDTVIVLNLAKKVEQGTLYNVSSQQQIVSGSKTSDSDITKKEIKHSVKGNIWALCYNETVLGSPTFSRAEGIVDRKDNSLTEPAGLSTYYKDKYFLYAKGQLYGTYDIMREALVEASKLAGVVTDCENEKLYYREAKSKAATVLPQNVTLAAELLSDEDGVVTAWNKNNKEANAIDISGFATEDMLLFVSKGFPVLARYDANTFVWIIGYTEDIIKCQRSDSQEIFEISKEEAEERFGKTGYEFYTCNN